MKPVSMQFSLTSYYFPPLRSKYLTQHPIPQKLHPTYFGQYSYDSKFYTHTKQEAELYIVWQRA
jgi:hypothetical protein